MFKFQNNFRGLCDDIIEINGHRECVLSFSCGKDSIAMFLRVLESGKFDKIHLFYMYLIPELSWIDDYIDYFQRKFGVEIHQMPSPQFYKMMKNYVLQPPERADAIKQLQLSGSGFIDFKNSDCGEIICQYADINAKSLIGVGITMFDSPMRRKAIKEKGPLKHNMQKWYPIWDFKISDIRDIIKKHDVKLPLDYDLFGLSFDGLDYRFLKPIKDRMPGDYKKIKEYFPLIDLMIDRQENYLDTKLRRGRFKIWENSILTI